MCPRAAGPRLLPRASRPDEWPALCVRPRRRPERACGAPLHQDLYKTAIEFLKLEKIEVGGARGNTLGSLVTRIYEEVFELVKVFADCKYDPLDPGDPVSHVGGPGAGGTRRGRTWRQPQTITALG